VRICVIGKFPPIQGGVSMRTYWAAHALAMRGHEVQVVTNAKEARPPFRMHMRPQDWARCEARYDSGSVTVHWTDPVDGSQSYIPMASPFISKLATVAAQAHSERPFDVIYSHYLEPYGVAGHLAAQITGVPHVARMAGSDAGRLWRHPQFELLYDHVLRSAELVIATGPIAKRAIERRIDPARIVFGGGIVVPDDVFTPDGPALDLKQVRREVAADPDLRDLMWGDFAGGKPYFGICGKLGDSKGSFPLLAAMHRLKRAGLDVGLVALAQGQAAVQKEFRARARKLGLTDRILQLPFLPHWRVPELLRGCLAVCCLEQDFPIVFHTPIIPREVLLCGACLVGSTEVIRKLPGYGQLVHGYGCVAIEDVNDVEVLSERLAAIVRDPKPAAAVGARGRRFARELQQEMPFAQMLEQILEAAAKRQGVASMTQASPPYASANQATDELTDHHFPLTRLAEATIERAAARDNVGSADGARPIDLARARQILAIVERRIAAGETSLAPLVPAVAIEIAIAAAEDEAATSDPAETCDPLFRLRIRRWAMADGDLARLMPVRDPRLRVLEFDYNVRDFMAVRTVADFPPAPTPGRSHIIVFGRSNDEQRNPLVIDELTAKILHLSDGTRTVAQIAGQPDRQRGRSTKANLEWIEGLLVRGLILLQDTHIDSASAPPSKSANSPQIVPTSRKQRPFSQMRTDRRQHR
jgi:glycosyltransferase involved in cell wall biosynthesis